MTDLAKTNAQLARARAAMDPNAAIEAAPLAEAASFELEAPAGVVAVERARGITMAVEIETPPPHRRWRWFLSYLLLRLAARVYPFRLELYRTRRSWE